jgi:hypothetical protein
VADGAVRVAAGHRDALTSKLRCSGEITVERA